MEVDIGAHRITPTSSLRVILGLPPLPLKLQYQAGITIIVSLNKPFQNSEELLPFDVEHIEVGWIKQQSIFLHESRISLEDGRIVHLKSGIITEGSKTNSGVGLNFVF
ncbi:hypothetical protein AVEN_28639-1 [Araneus ventricosus]|uniref:Uncharacterized protein n=1 Tax=Araneus ventricosus TaxID=182803 RepID=A0A4Y2FGW3_ARAVE|nr:hypothetical protein AVEN_28639-1 [Araneus ventricosus]